MYSLKTKTLFKNNRKEKGINSINKLNLYSNFTINHNQPTMKPRKILSLTLLAFALIFNSCGSDEKPSMKFSFDGNSISLTGANIYLQYSNNCCNNYDYRQYYITDGTYTSGERYDITSYTNATYLMTIELGIPGGTTFAPGNYPQNSNWGDLDGTELVSFIYFESGEGNDYKELGTITDGSSIKVSGGFDDGEKMTLKFTGALYYEYFDGVNWVENEITSSFNFSGKVQDERPI